MSKKIAKKFQLHIAAAAFTPGPPIGPMLWQNGVPIGIFSKDFNEKTKEINQKYGPVKVPVWITVYADKTYDLEILPPITSHLIMWKLGIKLWAATPNKQKLGTLTRADLEEIAEVKKPVMNTDNVESIMKSIAGTAKNMWVDVKW